MNSRMAITWGDSLGVSSLINIHHPGTGHIVSGSPDALKVLSPLDRISLATIPAASFASKISPLSFNLTSTASVSSQFGGI